MELIIKPLNVEIEVIDGPIGISCSGGADSSLLLYILMMNTQNTIHIFTTTSNFKQRKNTQVSINVIEKCIELTNNTNIQHHINYCETQTINKLFVTSRHFLNNNLINGMYTGITNTPPISEMNKFKSKIEPHDAEERNPNILYKPTKIKKYYMPFRNIDKRKIADLYKHFDIIESLFPVTRSCEWISSYDIPDPGLGHCGECWWCNEREWAFKEL